MTTGAPSGDAHATGADPATSNPSSLDTQPGRGLTVTVRSPHLNLSASPSALNLFSPPLV